MTETVEESPDCENPLKQQKDVVLLSVDIEHEDLGNGHVHIGRNHTGPGDEDYELLHYDVPPTQVSRGIYTSLPQELFAACPTFAWHAFVGELNQAIAAGTARLEHHNKSYACCIKFAEHAAGVAFLGLYVSLAGFAFADSASIIDYWISLGRWAVGFSLALAIVLLLSCAARSVAHSRGPRQYRNVLLRFHCDLQQVCTRYSIITKDDDLHENGPHGMRVLLNFEGPRAVFEDVERVENREGVPRRFEVRHIRCNSLNIRIVHRGNDDRAMWEKECERIAAEMRLQAELDYSRRSLWFHEEEVVEFTTEPLFKD